MKKRLLSFLLALVMMITVVPALSVSAAPVEVDLIHNEDGSIKDGVFLTSSGGVFLDMPDYALSHVINNNFSDTWCSDFNPSDNAWVQLNFPVAQKMTEITIKSTYTGDYLWTSIKVMASNDATFTTSTTLLEQDGGYAASTNFVINDAEKLATPYRYLRVTAASSHKRLGISEIDVSGYASELPTTEGLTELTQKVDVVAKVPTEDANAYTAQQVLDGDSSTGYVITGATTPELVVDLKRDVQIKAVDFLPASGDVAYAKDYEIHISNSPTFADYNLVYRNDGSASADGTTVRAYMPENTSGRYVRIKSTSSSLGVAELNVWGVEPAFTLENMLNPACVSASSGANPEYTVDNDLSTVYKSAEEATKSYLIYDLERAMAIQAKELLATTSIMLMPVYDASNEEIRKNFNIYGSITGDFSDAELIESVGDTPLAIGEYKIINLDEPRAYKKIKIEKATEPSVAESLGFREVKILHNSLDSMIKVESTLPADGATGVTNFGENPDALTNLIEVELNRNIVASSINPTNVVIKDITDGANTTLTNWEAYQISGKKFSIDVSNLSSNKTYEVTVTTDVQTSAGPISEERKFTFTTGYIINIPYDPSKVLLNVVTGKTITGNVNAESVVDYPLSKMTDGDDLSFGISDAPKIQIDMGRLYDVVAVQIVPRTGDPHGTISNLNILGSDAAFDFNSSNDVLMEKAIATYPSSDEGAKTFIMNSPKSIRYLGIYRATTYLALGEIRAYAYVDRSALDFGEWKVNDQTGVEEFASAGTYTFSAYVKNLSADSTNVYMTVFAYDENGAMIQRATGVKPIASGTQTVSLGVTLSPSYYAKANKIVAMILESQGNATMLVDAKTITKAGAGSSGPTSASGNDSIKLDYTAKTPNERVVVQVLGPNSSGLGYDFNTINQILFNVELCYSSGTKTLAKDEKATFYFKVPNPSDYGEYSIRMTVTENDGTKSVYYSHLLYLSQADIDECLADFVAFPSTLSMRQLIDKWTDNLPTSRKYIKMTDLPATLSTSVPEKFDSMFEYLCDLYVADGNMTEIADVIDCLNAAYVMSMYEAGDATAVKNALTKYEGNINGLYARKDTTTNEEFISVEKYSAIYTALKSNVTDAATLKNVMQWTVPLSIIQNGTRQDVKYAMENYSSVLGYDLSYATSRNVTLAQVAMKIEIANAGAFYNAFDDAFEDAVDAVVAERDALTDSDSTIPPVVTPGVGAHGSRPASPSKPDGDKPTTPVSPVEPDGVKQEENLPFNDINNIVWAKDYISVLYNNGIVSGDGDGSFHPNRQVTREEFLKMLIEALKIDVASKEATEFDDCDADAWYYPYVQIASSNKITKGINRKNFGIGQNITRQDMAVLLSKALAIKNITAIESDYVFGDENEISDYAQSDVRKMYSLGIVSGMGNGTFAPKDYTTRAQAAVIIGRALEILGGASK